jgi:hypothetical protein
MQCGANLADESDCSRERKIDLQGNRKPGALTDGLCRSWIALSESPVDHDGCEFSTTQCGKRCLSSLSDLDLHAQLRGNHSGAVASALNSRHHQNAHLNSSILPGDLRQVCACPHNDSLGGSVL